MQLKDVAAIRPVDWILIASIAMFFLGVTGGFWELQVAADRQDDPYILGGLLFFAWIGLRFYPPKPIERRNQTEVADTKERRRANDTRTED